MKEDERILNAITPIVNARKTHKDDNLYSLQLNSYQLDMIQGLLDLYIAEKEKNKALKEGLKYRINYCKLLEKELYANGVNYEFEKTEIEKQLLEE